MTSVQSSTKVTSSENVASDSLKDTFEIHSNLVSSADLIQVLESCLQVDTFTVEMRHSVYIIRVNDSCTKEEKASLEEMASEPDILRRLAQSFSNPVPHGVPVAPCRPS
ncbi:hypothetical protein CDEST_04320 [Colletotrichum destructivum]|uniref:Uncharacterized protein n=1 Tax=Colletotrichum destructivum TaxID=34406 RepID=A0AAX4I7V7_9PEZI|nr:hypothetical protein CDEST_04320 [Colletotrichum destructivum]